ncbi:hypothetical protein J4729_16585 [Leisingera sp. HS039]|uniref:hypothetical protein n=1 Tax=Leisingera sp. HS039 TaxID=2818496 RepID=UPI0010712F98|nr:hypothetical protein [Leisingera sp. HS039]MBQ4826156.1 hypothetical protein [Leisingera sp. HS039]QBR38623.1 hypothetical protein ETW23_22275 [Leisingera sp. NJS201]
MFIYTICNLMLPAVAALISCAIQGFAGRMDLSGAKTPCFKKIRGLRYWRHLMKGGGDAGRNDAGGGEGGRRLLRHVMFQAALVAAHHNPVLKPFADRLRKAGKSHKFIIIAVARKLVSIVSTLSKSRRKRAAQTV